MITFQQASPTVFMYETSPSYWQVQAGTEEERSDRDQSNRGTSSASASANRKAFRNFAVTNDSSCLCFTMQVSSAAQELSVELVAGDRLHISCSFQGQRMVVDRVLKASRLDTDNISAHRQSTSGVLVLTVRIPKIRRKRSKTDPLLPAAAAAATQFRIPVADAYADEKIYCKNSNRDSNSSIKRLELEIPFSIQARAVRVVFDESQQKLHVSGRQSSGQTNNNMEPSFTSKFNISSQRIQVHKLQARLFRTSSKSSLLVITAPTLLSTAPTPTITPPQKRRFIPISEPHSHTRSSSSSSNTTTSTSRRNNNANSNNKAHPSFLRHQITPAALELTTHSANTVGSYSAYSASQSYNLLKNQLQQQLHVPPLELQSYQLEATTAVEAAYAQAADAHKMLPETLRRLV